MDKVAGHVDNGLAWNLNIILDFHYYDALMINPKANTARFTAIWRQIARRFASRPDAICGLNC
jgi:aryl-phospho-beta-D-glucosidase BglC (GH1 family)